MIHNQTDMKISVGNVEVEGTLTMPPGAKGVVVSAYFLVESAVNCFG
jgi:hypothetical protein